MRIKIVDMLGKLGEGINRLLENWFRIGKEKGIIRIMMDRFMLGIGLKVICRDMVNYTGISKNYDMRVSFSMVDLTAVVPNTTVTPIL
jgi:hypothetical protein